jgi:hypothetical protein
MARPHKYRFTNSTVINAWALKYPSVRTWLSKLNGKKPEKALQLFHFCEWSKLDPEQLLAKKEDPRSLEAERLLDRFILEAPLTDSTRFCCSISVRSFFRCNYRQLQSQAGKMDYANKKSPKKPDREKLLRLYQEGCYNPRDRALLCIASCTAMALETVSLFKWKYFEPNWQQQEIPNISLPPEILKGHGKGKYKGVRQETFLTPEAKSEILKYRSWMTKKAGIIWTEDMPVFLCLDEPNSPLTYPGVSHTMQYISTRVGVPFSIHDGRRIVQTALENVGTCDNWIRKIKGRKVRGEEAPYSRPAIEQLRNKYREALPDLEFLSQPKPHYINPREKFLEAFAIVLEEHPEKFEKFEEFILKL